PCWCTMRQTLLIDASNTPCVDGYVTIKAPSVAWCSLAFASRSATSMLPCASVFTTTTVIPAITALAGLVPCADCGIRQVMRWASPRWRWYARITSSPANSPCEPAFGCSDTLANPVISASHSSSWRNSVAYPCACDRGAKGCRPLKPRQLIGMTSVVARSRAARFRQRPQVDRLHARDVHDARQHIRRYFDGQRIEEMGIGEAVSELFERCGERSRVRVHPPGDAAQPLRAVIHRVHRGNHGEEYLGGADVARRLP